MLRTQRNSSRVLGVEKRVAHAPRGEREFQISTIARLHESTSLVPGSGPRKDLPGPPRRYE